MRVRMLVRHRVQESAVVVAIAMVLLTISPAKAKPLPLEPVADVPLGGNTTRLDYASNDSGRHLLFLAHLGDSAVIVFDTQAQRAVSRIAHVSKVHGVLAVPELGRAYALATGSNEVVTIDESSLRITARMPVGSKPHRREQLAQCCCGSWIQ
jgi:DNA-binding beta-propeller fold protein YncE